MRFEQMMNSQGRYYQTSSATVHLALNGDGLSLKVLRRGRPFWVVQKLKNFGFKNFRPHGPTNIFLRLWRIVICREQIFLKFWRKFYTISRAVWRSLIKRWNMYQSKQWCSLPSLLQSTRPAFISRLFKFQTGFHGRLASSRIRQTGRTFECSRVLDLSEKFWFMKSVKRKWWSLRSDH